jgi:Tfp pilus assembly protein PilF
LDPDFALAYFNLGSIQQMQGNLDDAIMLYRKAIKLDPRLVMAHNNLGAALRAQEEFNQAIASFRKVIELDPDNAMVHANLGIVLQVQGKLDKAIASYRKAIEQDPDYAEAHHKLGMALLVQGKLIEAEGPLREALRLNPNPQLQAQLEFTLTLDRRLLGFLQKDGVGHPAVKVLVQQFSEVIPFWDAPQELMRKFWEDHREEVLRELEQRTLTVVSLPKEIGAQKIAEEIRNKLLEGVAPDIVAKEYGAEARFDEKNDEKRAAFAPELHGMVFETPVGEVSEIIDALGHLFIAKVDASTPGKADGFEWPGVKEAAENAFNRQRRNQWEKSYLERLQKRIREDGE